MIKPRVLDTDAIAELSHQMRQPDQRRADLRAQLAAERVGARRLLALHERVGGEALTGVFDESLHYAERRTRACLRELRDGTRAARDVLEARDGDLPITVRATVSGDRLTLDFTGSHPSTTATSTARWPLRCRPATSRSES